MTEHVDLAQWRRPPDAVVVLTGNGGGPQQAISSSVPSVVCKGTVTEWLMDSEWFATGSQELWEKPQSSHGKKIHCHEELLKKKKGLVDASPRPSGKATD